MQGNQQYEQALLSDEHTLVSFSQDFGKIVHTQPAAVCIPENSVAVQSFIQYAFKNAIPVAIRGNGLSQNGQSLPIDGGITVSMQAFNKVLNCEKETVEAEANTPFSAVLAATLPAKRIPPVLPYNCNLSLGGVLSAGGVGASSFKYGPVVSQVSALEVVDGKGELQQVDAHSPLFHACLGGQGQFGIITKATLRTRVFQSSLKTFCLIYDNMTDWLSDFEKVRTDIDYAELFCSPSMQGARITDKGRMPMAQWLFGMHISIEFEHTEPVLESLNLHPWRIVDTQEEPLDMWIFRHNGRFEAMKKMGQWDLLHPWYECFIPVRILEQQLPALLETIPLFYANLIHIVPVKPFRESFLQLPDGDAICAFMILNPGLPTCLEEGALQVIQKLDGLFLSNGGKRYLSGYLGGNSSTDYWKRHFGNQYETWLEMKERYDPARIFRSCQFG